MIASSSKKIILIAVSYLICHSAMAVSTPKDYEAYIHVENLSGYPGEGKPIYDKVILACDNGFRAEILAFGSASFSATSALGVDNVTRQCELSAEQSNKIISLATFSITYDFSAKILQHGTIIYNPTQVCNPAYNPICEHDKPDPRNFYMTASRHYSEISQAPCVCNYSN